MRWNHQGITILEQRFVKLVVRPRVDNFECSIGNQSQPFDFGFKNRPLDSAIPSDEEVDQLLVTLVESGIALR